MGNITTSNSWITLDEAETYFATRLGASKFWNESITEPDKEAALITAYNQLTNSKMFSLSADADAVMKQAQCEMALFLLIHQEDMDLRLGLQSQGVTQSSIAGESYKLETMNGIVIPENVKSLLKDYLYEANFFATDVTRDDSEDV